MFRFLLLIFGIAQTAFAQRTMTTNEEISTVCLNIFIGTDERNWPRVERAFAPTVLLDYSSMSGQPAANLTPRQITTAWKGLLPGFDHTHHQIGNIIVTQHLGRSGPVSADVFCYGTATHYIANAPGGNLWTVVGTYSFHLVRAGNGTWQVDKMRFDVKYQDGNLELPKLATERAKLKK